MSNFVDIAYSTPVLGRPLADIRARMQAVVLPPAVLENMGIRVTSDNTPAANPVVRTIQFAFGPSGTTDATATIQNDGSIISIVPGNRGDDYVRPPIVRLSPIVTNSAILRAFLRVKDFTITAAGVGYAAPPTVQFLGGLPPAQSSFRGCVRTLSLVDGGLGYPIGTTCTIEGGSRAGGSPTFPARATMTQDASGVITSVTLIDMGAGYEQIPKVVFHTHGTEPRKVAKVDVAMAEGTPARGTVTVNGGGNITGVVLSNTGSGYVSVPTLLITPTAGGTGGIVTARLELERVDVLFAGSGYPAIGTTVAFTPYFKSLYPDGSGQDKPFIEIFKSQFAIDAVTAIAALAPVLS